MYQRRDIVKGMASLPLAAVLANATVLEAVAAEMKTVEAKLAGGKTVKAALAFPEAVEAPAVILIHEWWGLNKQIKAVAAEIAKQGFIALAIDLYDGNVATTPDDARKFMKAVDFAEAVETTRVWANWLRDHNRCDGQLATIGWCFGGGWSLSASLATPVEATVVYYGNVARKADELANLNGPVLGHFAIEDKWINKKMVDGFEAEMKKAEKDFTTHWYEANHAFANPTSARYDEEDAEKAWERTTEFLKKQLLSG